MSETQPVRFCGQFRTGLTEQEAKIDSRVLRYLYTRGKQTESILANRLGLDRETLDGSLKRLTAIGLVEYGPAYYASPRQHCLTKEGEYWALEMLTMGRIAGKSDLE